MYSYPESSRYRENCHIWSFIFSGAYMDLDICYKSPTSTVYYQVASHTVVALWSGVIRGQEFCLAADAIEQAMIRHRTHKLLTYSSPKRIIEREANEYLAQTWLPRVAQTTIRYWADVVPAFTHIRKLNGDQAAREIFSLHGILIGQFATMKSAEDWLKEQEL